MIPTFACVTLLQKLLRNHLLVLASERRSWRAIETKEFSSTIHPSIPPSTSVPTTTTTHHDKLITSYAPLKAVVNFLSLEGLMETASSLIKMLHRRRKRHAHATNPDLEEKEEDTTQQQKL